MRRTTTTAFLGLCVGLSMHARGARAAPAEAAPVTPTSEASAPTNPGTTSPTANAPFVNQDRWSTPRPQQQQQPNDRRWQIRQQPLAGAEPSWGPPGSQLPEYAEFEPEQAPKGPPPKGTGRIVTGAILGPLGLGLTIAGIVGATTQVLGTHKQLSVPMIGGGLVTTALGFALLADGILRRQRFMRWQKTQVSLVPAVVPGRFAGATLTLRF